MSSFTPDPAVTDAEEMNFILRLEDRYAQRDMFVGLRGTSVDPIGYGRWSNSYFIKRQTGQPHEQATQAVLAEIDAIVHPVPVPPFTPAPREYTGDMCGVRIPGLPPVPGGAADPTLFLSWFYDRYDTSTRATIRAAYRQRGYVDMLLSWPDARANGCSPEQFKAICLELIAEQFIPCVMWCSKDIDAHDVDAIKAAVSPALNLLIGVLPRACVGWELSLWLSPTQVQQLIDWFAPQVTPWGCRLYVHFQQGYFAFQQPGGVTADFWKLNVGKLTGVLHQRDLSWDSNMYQARIVDCLQRFAGGYGFPQESGFGHPFDFVALEITAMVQFNGQMSEGSGQAWGRTAINTPASGAVKVMGSGNGS